MLKSLVPFVTCALLLPALGCSADSPADAPGQPTSATAGGPAADFEEPDLEAFERGLKKEIEAVRTARRQAETATDPQVRGSAMQAQFETATIPLGAEASGLGEDRYRQVRKAVHETFRTLDFQDKIDGPLSIDLSRVDESTRARLTRDPFTDLPPASAAALRARMDRLVPIWIEYINLTAVAG